MSMFDRQNNHCFLKERRNTFRHVCVYLSTDTHTNTYTLTHTYTSRSMDSSATVSPGTRGRGAKSRRVPGRPLHPAERWCVRTVRRVWWWGVELVRMDTSVNLALVVRVPLRTSDVCTHNMLDMKTVWFDTYIVQYQHIC